MNRICMYMPSASGGHPLYVQELMTAMVQRSGDAGDLELVSSIDLEDRFMSSQYAVHRILPGLRKKNEFGNRLSWACNRTMHYARRERCFLNWLRTRPDITAVHFQEFSCWLPTLLGAIRRMGLKIFYTAHFVRPHAYPAIFPHTAWDARHRLACHLCDRLFVLSEQVRDELAQFIGSPHPAIDIAPHGVWTIGQSSTSSALDQRLNQKKLLFFGTMRQNKGLDLVLEAMPQLPDFQLTIAGAPLEMGYFYNQVMPKVRQLIANGARIEVIDRYVNDQETASLFAGHSALLLPYTREFTAQSGVIFLALAHEIPVVCSDVGGLSDILHDFQIGAAFSESRADAFVAAVHSLFAQSQTGTLARNIRQARKHFSWNEAARATWRGYSQTFKEDIHANECAVSNISA